jgi:hypothetical protein
VGLTGVRWEVTIFPIAPLLQLYVDNLMRLVNFCFRIYGLMFWLLRGLFSLAAYAFFHIVISPYFSPIYIDSLA